MPGIFRWLQMGSGVLADCWRPEERGRGLMVYQLGPVLGPAIGPIGECTPPDTSTTFPR